MQRLLLTVSLICFSASTIAYQAEFSGHYNHTDESGFERTAFGADITWHFDDVDTRQGPLNEAAFLSPQSAVYVGWSQTDLEIAGLTIGGFPVTLGQDTTTRATTLGGRYVFADSRWEIGVQGRRDDNDGMFTSFDEVDTYAARLGYYITPHMKVSTGYMWSDESETTMTSGVCFPFPLVPDCVVEIRNSFEIEAKEYDVDLAYLRPFKNGWLAAGGGYSQAEVESTSIILLEQVTPTMRLTLANQSISDKSELNTAQLYGGWYFNARTGIKATISRADPESGSALMAYSLTGHYFITEAFKVALSVTQQERERFGLDEDDALTAGLSLQLRL
ncbi:MAG: putative porin [Pseudomonadales bacterium]